MSINQILDFVIVGGGVSGLSAASVISRSNSQWAVIERDYSDSSELLTPDDQGKVRDNIPSSKKENTHYWLREFEQDGWFSSSNNFSWGRVPKIGGRSNLWSGWSPLIDRADLLSYAAGHITNSRELWGQYLAVRNFLQVEERSTLFTDTPPYSNSTTLLGEHRLFTKLREALLVVGIETTRMPRPHHSKYNAHQVYKDSIDSLDKHVLKGVVVAITDAQSPIKILKILRRDNSSYLVKARAVMLAASTLETNRILADCLASDYPESIGSNIFDHAYIKDAITFRVAQSDQFCCNAKLYGKTFSSPDVPLYRAALQISATKADQSPEIEGCIGRITIVGEVPHGSHGRVVYSGQRDKMGRLIPKIDYEYRTEVKQSIRQVAAWLRGILSGAGIDIISISDHISRTGESLHEMGELRFDGQLTDGAVDLLSSVYVCDGAGYSSFGPEHPSLAISGLAKYVANIAVGNY